VIDELSLAKLYGLCKKSGANMRLVD